MHFHNIKPETNNFKYAQIHSNKIKSWYSENQYFYCYITEDADSKSENFKWINFCPFEH